MNKVTLGRRIWRLFRVVSWMNAGVFFSFRGHLLHGKDWYCSEPGKKVIQNWLKELADRLHLDIKVHGQPEQCPHVQVANHISWLDIVAMGANHHISFVSKSEVANWPIVGLLARMSGTCFIKRGSVSSLRALIPAFQRHFEKGNSLAMFPEGTTGAGNDVGVFSSVLFQVIIDAEMPVQPVMLYYHGNDEQRRQAAYIEDDRFFSHLWSLTCCDSITVELQYLPVKHSGDKQRRLLASLCQQDIASRHWLVHKPPFDQAA